MLYGCVITRSHYYFILHHGFSTTHCTTVNLLIDLSHASADVVLFCMFQSSCAGGPRSHGIWHEVRGRRGTH